VSSLEHLIERFIALRDERIRLNEEYRRVSDELALTMQAAGIVHHATPKGAVKLVSYTRWRTKNEKELVAWLIQRQFIDALDVNHSAFTKFAKRFPQQFSEVMHGGLIEPTIHLRVQVSGSESSDE
jgi:hypothetical protein